MSRSTRVPPRVRESGPGDLDDVLALRQALFPELESQAHAQAADAGVAGSHTRLMLVAEGHAGALVGFLEAHAGPDGAWLRALFVAPEHRRAGVARRLIEEAESRLAAMGIQDMALELPLDQEARIQPLEGLGFQATAKVVRLTRRLTAPLPEPPPAPGAGAATSATVTAPGERLAAGDEALLRAAAARGEEPVVVIHPPARRMWTLFNVAMAVAALICLANTNIFSPDLLPGAVLPVLDVLFVLYFVGVLVSWRYRRKTDSSRRAEDLFGAAADDDGA